MKKLELSKEADLLLALVPFLFVGFNYLSLAFQDKGLLLIHYCRELYEFLIKNNENSFSILINPYLVAILIIIFLIVGFLFGLCKNRFYYVWLGFGGTFAFLLIAMTNSNNLREWLILNYLKNYVFVDKTFLKGLEVYIIILIVMGIISILLRRNKVYLINMIDLSFSSYFALSTYQYFFYLYDVPDAAIPLPKMVIVGTILYNIGVFTLAFLFFKSNCCKKKLIIWVVSFPILGFLLGLLWIFCPFFTDLASVRDYVEYYFVRSDVIFYFIFFCFLCCFDSRRLRLSLANNPSGGKSRKSKTE